MKHIVIIAPPNATLLDIAGPLDVFTKTIEYQSSLDKKGIDSYIVHVVSLNPNVVVKVSSGISLIAESPYYTINYEIDTLIIAGVPELSDISLDQNFIDWLVEKNNITRRICSVCTGTFILAQAGILDGRKATTHWDFCERLAKSYPHVEVNPNPIFIKDGNMYTSAGITAGMDLALYLVEEDFGKTVALEVARKMVLFLKRSGNQSQYSTTLKLQQLDHRPIEKAINWAVENLSKNLSVEVLADKALMSPRNFSRVFTAKVGCPPGEYIQKLKIDTARKLLESTELSIDEIGIQCGYKNAENLRRAFLKFFGTLPTHYRASFRGNVIE